MKKVRLKESYIFMKEGKVYDVIEEDEFYYTVIGEDGGQIEIRKHYFEDVEEPNYVMVKYSSNNKWCKRILLHDLGEQFEYRYITVVSGHEDDFINGAMVNCISSWRYMKPINEVEKKIEELEQKLAELKQQINK